jgi:hypothetical protein
MTHSKKTVFTLGAYAIVRTRYWGFRCNSLSTIWEVTRDGQFVGQHLRLKNAKQAVLAALALGAQA